MEEALESVFVNWTYNDWACEKAYTALFVYYPDIAYGSYILYEWLYLTAIIFICIGMWIGYYIGKKKG